MQCSTSSRTSSFQILYLYLGVQTIWYVQCQMACDIFLNRLIVLSFLLLWGQLLKDNNEPFYRQTRKTSLTTFTERGFLTRIKYSCAWVEVSCTRKITSGVN